MKDADPRRHGPGVRSPAPWTLRRLAPLLGLALLGVLSPARAALTLPIEYTGVWHLTVTVTNSFGTGRCTDSAAASMTLQADGTAVWRAAEITAHLLTPSGQAPSCEIRASGQTVTWLGTHDGVSRFSLPSGSTLPPITGDFDAQAARARYEIGTHTVIEWNLSALTHQAAIEPDPTIGFAFQTDILEGKGFRFVFVDPHGRDHLDFSTLRVLVAGADVTQHVLSRVIQGIVPMTEENRDSRSKVFHLRPDPTRLMQGHDVFAIPFNGDWRIELRICDKAGACFGKVYDKVYFGPFVSASPVYRVIDGRCLDKPDPYLRVQAVTIGNMGNDAPRVALYVGLTSPSQGTWTYSSGDIGYGTWGQGWFQDLILPLEQLPLASGFLVHYELQLLPDWVSIAAGTGPATARRGPFPGGDFTLVLAAVDGDTGAYRRDEHAVTMCDR